MTRHTLLGICGSLRAPSVNLKLLNEAIRVYGSATAQRADLNLPLYNGDIESLEGIPAGVQTLANQIAQADAVILSSPEYNKAITGVLKNALDWVSRTKGNPWLDKPVAIMSANAGRSGGETGQYTVRHALAPFRPRLATGPALMLADAANQFDAHGRLINDRARDTLTDLMNSLRKEVERLRL